MARAKKKSNKVKVNFDGVESGGKSLPDGTYHVKVDAVEKRESSEGNDFLSWRFKVTGGKFKGAAAFDNTSLQPQALFRLRGLLESLGEDIGDEEFEMDLTDYVGKELVIDVVNEEYQGKKTPKVGGYAPLSDDEEEDADEEESDDSDDAEEEDADEEEEKPAKKSRSKKKAAEPEEEEGEEDSDEEEEEDSDDSDDEEEEEEEESDDEEEEEEEEPAPKSRSKKKTVKAEAPEDEDDEDEDEGLKVGQKVKFVDPKGKALKGKIVKLLKKDAMIDVAGKEWKVPLDEITPL